MRSQTTSFLTEVDLDDESITIEVIATAYPAEGDNWHEPRIPAGVQVDGICDIDGKDIPEPLCSEIFALHGDVLRQEAEDFFER